MATKKILFICGSLNQTTMMHKISKELEDHDLYFTPYYCEGLYRPLHKVGLLDFTILGGQNFQTTQGYLEKQRVKIDYEGRQHRYDLVVTCTDLMVQKNVRNCPSILVQEGMTDPESFMFHVIRYGRKLGLPLWLASTSTTGLSDAYQKFCVASDGYRDHFQKKGVKKDKLVVTGIPNFDNVEEFFENDFPHHNFVLVATTDTRENFKWDNRKKFLANCVSIANGSPLIFKLHPNENTKRSTREIHEIIPHALVYQKGNASEMIANCHTLITQYSTLAHIGLAMKKKVYSYFDLEELKRLVPIQNGGTSAANISKVCREYL